MTERLHPDVQPGATVEVVNRFGGEVIARYDDMLRPRRYDPNGIYAVLRDDTGDEFSIVLNDPRSTVTVTKPAPPKVGDEFLGANEPDLPFGTVIRYLSPTRRIEKYAATTLRIKTREDDWVNLFGHTGSLAADNRYRIDYIPEGFVL